MRGQDRLGLLIAYMALIGVAGVLILSDRSAVTAAPQMPDVTTEHEVTTPEDTTPDEAPDAVPEDMILERPIPLHLRISTIGVDAPLVGVGLEADGETMEIPDQVAEVGWYDPEGLGVTPGAPGTAVLAGHVDSRRQGRGALYDLRDLQVGAHVEIDLSDGNTQRWRITDIIQYPKDVLPYDDVFVWSGPARLAVITCGGEFDRTARSYTDNIVAYAEPIEDGPISSASSGPLPPTA